MSRLFPRQLVLGLAVSLLFVARAPAALTNNLQLYSPLDSITPPVVASYWQDVSGNGHHAKADPPAYDGTSDVGGANRGTAIDFVSTIIDPQFNSKQITLQDGLNWVLDPGTSDFSISFWYSQPELDAATPGVTRHVLNKGNSTAETSPGFCIFTSGGTLTLRSEDASGDVSGEFQLQHLDEFGSPVVLANTGWHHVTGVFDRSGTYSPADTVTLYVDGAAVATGVLPLVNLAPNNISAPTLQVLIGGKSGSDTTRDFEGYMDDIAFYRGALSPTQVQTLYQATTFDQTTISDPNITPVFVHNFVTNAGVDPVPAQVPDVYGTPNVPGTVYGSDATIVTDATRGNVLGVNANTETPSASNYVDFGDNLDPGTTSYTVSVWVKKDGTVATSQQFATKGAAAGSTEGWALGFKATGELYARGNYIEGATGTQRLFTSTETAVSADVWHHVALVIDQAAGLFQAYVDGVGSGTDGDNGLWNCDELNYSVTFPADGSADFDATQLLRLGRSGSSTAPYAFKGLLDDFAIWNRALTSSEILAIYQGADILPPQISVPGDTDGYNVVDDEDAAVVAEHWGSVTATGPTQGDFNADGKVNALDAAIQVANWGSHVAGAESSAVPEPSVLLLLCTMLAVVVSRRRIG